MVLSVSPEADGQVVIETATGGAIPKAFAAAVEKGIRSALQEGPRGFRSLARVYGCSMARRMRWTQ